MVTVCAKSPSLMQVGISVIQAAAVSLGYNVLKTEHEQVLEAFSRGKDVSYLFQQLWTIASSWQE